jgi:putative PIN family toxin of toxin-antitoxin system
VITPKINLIIDTNVWLDWLLFNDDCVLLLKSLHSEHKVQLIATHQMRAELEEVLHRPAIGPKFIARSSFDSIEAILREFDRLVAVLPPPAVISDAPQCKDLDDQIFIDLAIAENAYLISKDRALLALASKMKALYGVPILTPRAFHYGA